MGIPPSLPALTQVGTGGPQRWQRGGTHPCLPWACLCFNQTLLAQTVDLGCTQIPQWSPGVLGCHGTLWSPPGVSVCCLQVHPTGCQCTDCPHPGALSPGEQLPQSRCPAGRAPNTSLKAQMEGCRPGRPPLGLWPATQAPLPSAGPCPSWVHQPTSATCFRDTSGHCHQCGRCTFGARLSSVPTSGKGLRSIQLTHAYRNPPHLCSL